MDIVAEDVTLGEKSGKSFAAEFCQRFDPRSWLDQALWVPASAIRSALIKDG